MRDLPPVPSRLREMLKDYPELIEKIQEVLNKVAANGLDPRFDWAVTRLKDTMEAFYIDAASALREVEKLGDTEAIALARKKEFTIGRTRSEEPWFMDDEFYSYWQNIQD